jgi:sodium-dependent phosphate transporter
MFLWIVVTGGIFSFISAMGIGANDAANAFATSVGSKALTIKQAAGLAVVFETAGAILMGNHVTDTIRKGIADYKCFENEPELLMYGCMWVIISVGAWLFIATYCEMPVSTTHSCVGGMIGMTIALAGTECVIWYKQVDSFPYVGGVIGIVMSWVISPLFSGLLSSLLFALVRSQVLRYSYESKRLNYIYPLLVGGTLVINSFFIIYKGAKGLGLHNIEAASAIGISITIGSIGALLTIPFVPKIRKIVDNKMGNINNLNNNEIIETNEIVNNQKKFNINSESQLTKVTNLHLNAEKFDPRTEEVFKYLQIFSAICDSFSHGANDVANAVGPFAAIFIIYREQGNLTKKLDMENDAYWILSMGGIGIAIGLIVYGKKIIYAIGNKLCKITPSRGTCIELGSALVIIAGSRLKIPLSTTHCQVGATVGVGLLENKSCNKKIEGVNWWILTKTAFGWIITCVVVGLSAGILASQGAYAPIVKNLVSCNNNTLNYY